ncbi:MAG: haloalkane dehalogenase, partial [Pseudomonadota bacterium]
PTVESRRPIWRFTNEIPIAGEPAETEMAVNAYVAWLQETDMPKLLFHIDRGSLIPPDRVAWARKHLSNLNTIDLKTGGHFVQEEHPNRIGRELLAWLRAQR